MLNFAAAQKQTRQKDELQVYLKPQTYRAPLPISLYLRKMTLWWNRLAV